MWIRVLLLAYLPIHSAVETGLGYGMREGLGEKVLAIRTKHGENYRVEMRFVSMDTLHTTSKRRCTPVYIRENTPWEASDVQE